MTAAPAVTDQEGVGERFLDVLRCRGYAQTPPASLLARDPSVMFVNATMTPFKAQLVAGGTVGRTCQLQECVRATGETPWLFSFSMVGALTDGAHLNDVCVDVTEAILVAMPWLAPADLYALLDAEDDDLVEAMARAADRTGIRLHPTAQSRAGTRWHYGPTFPLSGRGMTFVARFAGPPCGAACAPDCECGRWQGFGNIIIIEGPTATYIEAGVGVESMRATRYEGDHYQLPEVSDACRARIVDGYAPAVAAQIVNLLRVIDRLVAHGATGASRGGGYVFRRFALRLLDLLRSTVDNDDWAATVRRICGPGEVADVLIAEGERRDHSRVSRRAAAAAYVRRRSRDRPVSYEDLSQTFGLDRTEAAAVLHESRSFINI